MDVKELAKGTFTSNKDTNVLATLDTSSITNRLFNSTGLGELDLNSVGFAFNAIVDKDKRLVGVVHFNNMKLFLYTYRVKYTLVKNIMAVPTEIIYPFNTMETVMNKFERSKVAFYRS
jgi:CIC family chloride channel protein